MQKRSNANEIRVYRRQDKELSTDKGDILNDLFNYYRNLLGEEKVNENNIKKYNFKMKKLDQKVKDLHPEINKEITYNEVIQVIKEIKNSAPGSNGLTIGFFKKFFYLFGDHFVEILNDSEALLPETFNETIIKLIMKNKNEIKDVNDLRPISLTNFEYRIFTKVLFNRFKKISSYLFIDCQTCSVFGRRINDCLNIIKDTIEHANISNKEAYIISFDQRKAFDSMSHEYLLLDHVNISQFLTNNIKRIYNQSFATLVVDKYISDKPFYIISGIKQGCALSMANYTLGINELAVRIYENPNINGYKLPKMIFQNDDHREIKASMYADDTAGFTVDLRSIDYLFDEFNQWGEISGASINEDKTKILAINSSVNEYKNIKFSKEIKILGIIFNKKGVDSINLINIKNKIENTLNIWNGIRFNLIDKITVIRTFGFSKLWYILNFITLSEEEIKKFETLAFKYIWNGNAELIGRTYLYSDFKDGGLNMVSIRAKIHMIFIRNLLYVKKNMNRMHYQFSIFWMKWKFKDFLSNFNILPGGLDNERPAFFAFLIECWKKFQIIFEAWIIKENERRKIIYEEKCKKTVDKKKIKPFVAYEKNFLYNINLLRSKFIYNLFLEKFSTIKRLRSNLKKKEEENIFLEIHKINSSNIRLVNYKLIFNSLPTNFKFNNRYDNICFMCKKKLNEDIQHIFVNCKYAIEAFGYVKNDFLTNKTLNNSVNLLEYKRNIGEDDYRSLSCYVYSMWRVRNSLKHNEKSANPVEIFKIYFNKWIISISNI